MSRFESEGWKKIFHTIVTRQRTGQQCCCQTGASGNTRQDKGPSSRTSHSSRWTRTRPRSSKALGANTESRRVSSTTAGDSTVHLSFGTHHEAMGPMREERAWEHHRPPEAHAIQAGRLPASRSTSNFKTLKSHHDLVCP